MKVPFRLGHRPAMWAVLFAAIGTPAFSDETGAQVGVGVSGGWYSCTGDFVGVVSYPKMASPFLFGSVDVGSGPAWWFVGFDSAPFLSYVAGPGPCHAFTAPIFMLTTGAWFGGDVVRVGPLVSVGLASLSAGGRIAYTPIVTRDGWHHGPELRVEWLVPDAGRVTMAYTWGWR